MKLVAAPTKIICTHDVHTYAQLHHCGAAGIFCERLILHVAPPGSGGGGFELQPEGAGGAVSSAGADSPSPSSEPAGSSCCLV